MRRSSQAETGAVSAFCNFHAGCKAVTVASSAEGVTAREPLLRLPAFPWPTGTAAFAVRTWVALAIAYYVAFFLEIRSASSAGVCVLILAQPTPGMVLSKAVYRLLATVTGVIVAVVLTALFPQDRTMLLASFAVIMAGQTALGSVFRDFRSYACILGGYTIAIISISNIDTPNAVLTASVDRVAAIVIGILAIAVTNAVLAGADASASLTTKLREAIGESVAMASEALDRREPPSASACTAMSARLMPLRGEIGFAASEKPRGRVRAKGGRSALLGLFEMISASQAVGIGLSQLHHPSKVVDEAIALLREALRRQTPERCLADLDALTSPALGSGSLSIAEAYVLERIRFTVETMGGVRDGMRSLRLGRRPRRDVALPVHQDWPAVAINAARVLVAVGVIALISVWSGIPDTAVAVLFTAVFVSLGAVQPDPNVMGKAALFGEPAVAAVGAVYAFLVFPNIDGYPLFIVSLAPLVLATCWFVKIGMGGAGLIFGTQTIVLIAPANIQTLDPIAFVNTATQLTFAGLAIFLTFRLILPVDPARRRLRIALATGDALRRALADKTHREQPRASLHYDRLAQFKMWQRDEVVTPTRHKTLERLVGIGNLSLAVRSAWRGLDAARPFITPGLDASARKALPSLRPAETFALADAYLSAAKGATGQPALTLLRAACALHGTALLTTTELTFLRHVGLSLKNGDATRVEVQRGKGAMMEAES